MTISNNSIFVFESTKSVAINSVIGNTFQFSKFVNAAVFVPTTHEKLESTSSLKAENITNNEEIKLETKNTLMIEENSIFSPKLGSTGKSLLIIGEVVDSKIEEKNKIQIKPKDVKPIASIKQCQKFCEAIKQKNHETARHYSAESLMKYRDEVIYLFMTLCAN